MTEKSIATRAEAIDEAVRFALRFFPVLPIYRALSNAVVIHESPQGGKIIVSNEVPGMETIGRRPIDFICLVCTAFSTIVAEKNGSEQNASRVSDGREGICA